MRAFCSFLAAVVVLVVAAAGVSLAGDKVADGKALYKQNCRVCHDKGSVNGEYSPLTLIQDQWSSFFKNKLVNSHKNVVFPNQNDKKLFDILTPDQIKVIQKFCVDHAADSEQPLTCS